ncbi:MAG: hypothetical protein KKA84_11990 [Bacteroidetes bacterium]|nr:hypothetical protein [Bacteroidota bacterium]
MPKMNSNHSTGGQSNSIVEGVYLSPARIKAIELNQNNLDGEGKPFNLALIVTLETGSGDKVFDNKLFIAGNFAESFNGWGPRLRHFDTLLQSSGVYNYFDADTIAQYGNQLELGTLPASLINTATGKEIQVVQYINRMYGGKARSTVWEQTFPIDAEREDIKAEWDKWQGYLIKNAKKNPFQPELMGMTESDQTSFNHGANVGQSTVNVAAHAGVEERPMII